MVGFLSGKLTCRRIVPIILHMADRLEKIESESKSAYSQKRLRGFDDDDFYDDFPTTPAAPAAQASSFLVHDTKISRRALVDMCFGLGEAKGKGARWTDEEKALFIRALFNFGVPSRTEHWREFQKCYFPHRSVKQCRGYWTHLLERNDLRKSLRDLFPSHVEVQAYKRYRSSGVGDDTTTYAGSVDAHDFGYE